LVVQVWYSLMTFGCIGRKPIKVAIDCVVDHDPSTSGGVDMADLYHFGAYTDYFGIGPFSIVYWILIIF
jgi:hypothetical protein